MANLSPFMVNFFVYGGFAAVYPFLVLYYQQLGYSGAQIGILNGIAPLVTLFSSPFWTNRSDRTLQHRRIMGNLILAGAGLMFLFPLFRPFAAVLVLSILFNAIFAPTNAFTDTATMHMLADRKDLYGRVRLGGTIGFGLAAPIAGRLVQTYGLPAAFWSAGVLFIVSWFFSRRLAFGSEHAAEKEQEQEPVSLGPLLRTPLWSGFLVIALAAGLGFSATGTFFYPYMASLTMTETSMGIATLVGTLAEIPVMFFGDRLLRRFTPYQLLLAASAFTVARIGLFAANAFPPVVFLIQLLNGLTFPLFWIAGVAYADKYAPERLKASMQGLFGAMSFGVGSSLGGFLGGLLLESSGPRMLLWVFGIVITGTVVGAAAFIKRAGMAGTSVLP